MLVEKMAWSPGPILMMPSIIGMENMQLRVLLSHMMTRIFCGMQRHHVCCIARMYIHITCSLRVGAHIFTVPVQRKHKLESNGREISTCCGSALRHPTLCMLADEIAPVQCLGLCSSEHRLSSKENFLALMHELRLSLFALT